MNKKNIGKNIQALRNMYGMTQTELAERVGVSTDHISHIEIGSGSISLPLLLEVCRLLNATPNDILSGEYSAPHMKADTNPPRKEEENDTNVDNRLHPNEIQLLKYMKHFMQRKGENMDIFPALLLTMILHFFTI